MSLATAVIIWRIRGIAVLRGCDHHAHLGAFRRRRPLGCYATLRALDRADRDRTARRLVWFRGAGRHVSAACSAHGCWFLVLALLGVISIVETPGILAALNPGHAVRFA